VWPVTRSVTRTATTDVSAVPLGLTDGTHWDWSGRLRCDRWVATRRSHPTPLRMSTAVPISLVLQQGQRYCTTTGVRVVKTNADFTRYSHPDTVFFLLSGAHHDQDGGRRRRARARPDVRGPRGAQPEPVSVRGTEVALIEAKVIDLGVGHGEHRDTARRGAPVLLCGALAVCSRCGRACRRVAGVVMA
jgi:hypothetical protein